MPKASVLPQKTPFFTPGSHQPSLNLLTELNASIVKNRHQLNTAIGRLNAEDRDRMLKTARRGQKKEDTLLCQLLKAIQSERAHQLTESRNAPKTHMHWTDLAGIVTTPYQKQLESSIAQAELQNKIDNKPS